MEFKKLNAEDLWEKWLCCECIGSTDLSNHVLTLSKKKRKCRYCHQKNFGIALQPFADIIDEAFEDHFESTSDQPEPWQERLHNDKESDYDWEREGEVFTSVLQDVAIVEEQVAIDVQIILEEKHEDIAEAQHGNYYNPYDEDNQYILKRYFDDSWDHELEDVSYRIKHRSRFFDPYVLEFFNSLFLELGALDSNTENPLLVFAGPGKELNKLFRARVFQSEEELQQALASPETNLGAPPRKFSRAGRMNPNGVPTFYGATMAAVALAEVRPPISSKVVIAEFQIIKDLTLLNITTLKHLYVRDSIFHSDYKRRTRQAHLVRQIYELMSKPVLPNSEEFEYIITQAVADYISNHPNIKIDGILYPSVQHNGTIANVVLFPDNSKVQIPSRGKPAILRYWRIGEDEYQACLEEQSSLAWDETTQKDHTLELNPQKIMIKEITGIDYQSNTERVIYNRFEKK